MFWGHFLATFSKAWVTGDTGKPACLKGALGVDFPVDFPVAKPVQKMAPEQENGPKRKLIFQIPGTLPWVPCCNVGGRVNLQIATLRSRSDWWFGLVLRIFEPFFSDGQEGSSKSSHNCRREKITATVDRFLGLFPVESGSVLRVPGPFW